MSEGSLLCRLRNARARLQLGQHHYDSKNLPALVENIAARLLDTGLDPELPLAILADDQTSLIMTLLAAHRLDIAALPLPRNHPQCEELLGQCGIGQTLHIHPDGFRLKRSASQHPTSPSPVRLLVATGGSGGHTRVAMLGAGQIMAAARLGAQLTNLDDQDGWLIPLPCHHIGGLAAIYRGLLAGSLVHVLQPTNTAELTTALRDPRISHVSLVPTQLARLVESAHTAPENLRCVLVGGAHVPTTLLQRATNLGWPVHTSYGMSESCAMVCMDGMALPETRIGLNADGRIQLSGPTIMLGYAEPGLRPGTGLGSDGSFCTSDLGRFNSQGHLQLLGRADHAFQSGGETLHPELIEAALADCSCLSEAAITYLADAQWGQVCVLVYRGTCDAAGVDTWCRRHLPPYWRPKWVFRVDRLPLSAAGKLDRRRLTGMASKLHQS
ncbi:MAG: AMP-binding protein [Chromatiales bacterium]|nr:AMP-binding protein [Chromatiales bacterium]